MLAVGLRRWRPRRIMHSGELLHKQCLSSWNRSRHFAQEAQNSWCMVRSVCSDLASKRRSSAVARIFTQPAESPPGGRCPLPSSATPPGEGQRPRPKERSKQRILRRHLLAALADWHTLARKTHRLGQEAMPRDGSGVVPGILQSAKNSVEIDTRRESLLSRSRLRMCDSWPPACGRGLVQHAGSGCNGPLIQPGEALLAEIARPLALCDTTMGTVRCWFAWRRRNDAGVHFVWPDKAVRRASPQSEKRKT